MADKREEKLRALMGRHLADGFRRIILEGPGEPWELRPETHPETGAAAIVARRAERADVQPAAELIDTLLRLSREGFHRHTYWLDSARRIELDARKARAREARQAPTPGQGKGPLSAERAAPLLQAIGIMNPRGAIPAKQQKKYKQVRDFVEVARPVIEKATRRPGFEGPLRVADLACGNSYLAFALAWALRAWSIPATILGVDRRADVIERSRRRAEDLGLSEMRFAEAALEAAPLGEGIDLAISLHACDTASDDAIIAAVGAGASALMIAPCCHNELFRQLEAGADVLTRHSLLRRAFAEALTDGLRAAALEALGFKVQALEFTAALHTSKSLMIRATRVRGPQADRRAAFEETCLRYQVRPKIRALFGEE